MVAALSGKQISLTLPKLDLAAADFFLSFSQDICYLLLVLKPGVLFMNSFLHYMKKEICKMAE